MMNGYSVWAIGQRASRGKELGEGSSALFLSRPRPRRRPRPRLGVNEVHAVKVQVFNAPIRLLRKHACKNLQRILAPSSFPTSMRSSEEIERPRLPSKRRRPLIARLVSPNHQTNLSVPNPRDEGGTL
jgi:hypothetical protein